MSGYYGIPPGFGGQLGGTYNDTAINFQMQLQRMMTQQMQYAPPPMIVHKKPPIADKPPKDSNVAWLDRRVNEIRMKL